MDYYSHSPKVPSESDSTTTPKHRGSLTPRGVRRRDALIKAAAEIFARQGYHRTSVSDIVKSERVAKGVFYWYFSSKEDLFAEILKEAVSGLRRAQAEAIAGISDPLGRIAEGIRASLKYVCRNQAMFAIFEEALGAPAFADVVKSGHKKLIADTIRHLEEGIRAGQIRKADPEILAHEIFGTMTYVARFLLPNCSAPESVIEETVEYCVNAIARRTRALRPVRNT
ncbi:MAG: hypothetical protein C4318_09050 [Acidimicrobiia bacterium]